MSCAAGSALRDSPGSLLAYSAFFADSRILPEAHSLDSVQGRYGGLALAEGPLLARAGAWTVGR
jgi:hypothetical protein